MANETVSPLGRDEHAPLASMSFERLESLFLELDALATRVGSAPDLNALSHVLLPGIVEILNPSIACFYAYDARSRRLLGTATYPESFWQRAEIRDRFAVRDLETGAIGRAIRTRLPVLVDDPDEWERRGEYVAFDPRVASEIVIPVLPRETPSGVLILSRFAPAVFTRAELAISQLVGRLLASAYAYHYDRHAKEQRLQFLDAALALNEVPLQERLDGTLRSLRRLLRCRFVSLWSYNELDETLVLRAFAPHILRGSRLTFDKLAPRVLDVGTGVARETILKRRPVVVDDILNHEQHARMDFAKKYNLTWLASVPIQAVDGSVLGVANLYPQARSSQITNLDDLLELASLMLSQLGSAMLLDSLKQRSEIAASYTDVFRAMFEGGDTRELWDDIATRIAKQLKCEACSVFMKDEQDRIVLKGTTGLVGSPPHDTVHYQRGEGVTGLAFQRNESVLYYPELEARYRGVHKRKFSERLRASSRSRSIVLVPIRDASGEPFGVIRCNNKDESPTRDCGRFTREDVDVLEAVGDVLFNTVYRRIWVRKRELEQQSYLNRLHHEVVSPLDGILNHIQWLSLTILPNLKDEVREDQSRLVERRTADVVEAVRLIDSIVKSLGYLDRVHLEDEEELNITDLLYTTRGWLKYEAQRRSVTVDIGYLGVPKVRGDRNLLLRVFYNLLMNAIKYCDRGQRTRFVRVSGSVEPGMLLIDIEDNGIGADLDNGVDLFALGARANNARRVYPEGTGLGLYFCKRILVAHGGDIILQQRADPTTFRVMLPIARQR